MARPIATLLDPVWYSPHTLPANRRFVKDNPASRPQVATIGHPLEREIAVRKGQTISSAAALAEIALDLPVVPDENAAGDHFLRLHDGDPGLLDDRF